MEKNKNYTWQQIEVFAGDNNFQIHEYGSNTVGRSFVLLDKEDKDCAISFILTGGNSQGFIYECIYCDPF